MPGQDGQRIPVSKNMEELMAAITKDLEKLKKEELETINQLDPIETQRQFFMSFGNDKE